MKRGDIRINVNDIVGKRLGKLEVKWHMDTYYSNTQGGDRMRHLYMCFCECGKRKAIQRGPLLNEIVHSCGCLRKTKRGK